VAWALSTSRLWFFAIWALLGACQAVLFYGPAFTVLTKWFDGHSRHVAITSVTLMGGLASTIFAPLTALLIATMGWRDAVIVLAAILGAITVPSFGFGLQPPPRTANSPSAQDNPLMGDESTIPSDALRTRGFWLLALAYLLSAVTTFAVAVHLVPYLRSHGIRPGTAAVVLGGVGLVQVLGRGTFIRLSAKRPSLHLATWVLAAKGLGLLFLFAPTAIAIVAFVAIYGSANGIATLTQATTLAELYGPDHYGSISAALGAIAAVGGALAPFLAATAIDRLGSEAPVFIALAVLSGLAAAANEAVARPSRRASLVVANG